MRSSRSFAKLLRMAHSRLARLKALTISAISPTTDSSARDQQLSYVVLEAHNLWANFIRSYLLSCLFLPRRMHGGQVTLGNNAIVSPGDLVHCAAKLQKGPMAPAPTTRRDEPKWHDVSMFLKTCQAIQCSHLMNIQAALSVQTRVFYDLPTFRNFYAHRNEESAEKALALARKQYLITTAVHPTDALTTPAIRRPQSLVLDWLDDMYVVMGSLCE